MGAKQLLDPVAIILVVNQRLGMGTLHDAGKEESHRSMSLSDVIVIKPRRCRQYV